MARCVYATWQMAKSMQSAREIDQILLLRQRPLGWSIRSIINKIHISLYIAVCVCAGNSTPFSFWPQMIFLFPIWQPQIIISWQSFKENCWQCRDSSGTTTIPLTHFSPFLLRRKNKGKCRLAKSMAWKSRGENKAKIKTESKVAVNRTEFPHPRICGSCTCHLAAVLFAWP